MILRAADFRETPWKNGAGTTLELAVHPGGAGLDAFEWRVSMARIERSGPFSRFPGVRRTILLVEGDGFELIGPGWTKRLDRPLVPFSFDGGEEVDCRLLGGAVRDFNVMTRQRTCIVRAASGPQRVAANTFVYRLGAHEAVWTDAPLDVAGETLIVVEF